MHDTWVRLELDLGRCDHGPELLSCQGPKSYWHHGVQLPMALKDGQVLGTAVGCLQANRTQRAKPVLQHNVKPRGHSRAGGVQEDTHLGEVPVQRQPAAQRHDAGQRVGAGKGCVQGQGPALEGGEDDRS